VRTIAACAPARVSLVGGGTDLPAFADQYGGAVVSFTIDRFAGVRITPKLDGLELASLDAGTRETIPSGSVARRLRKPILAEEHLLFPKAVAALHRLERGRIEVTSTVPIGAGLASSGSLAVALACAVRAYVGEATDAWAVAEDAFIAETDLLGRPVGRQDQYASAFGGLNYIEFAPGGARVQALNVDPLQLSSHIALFTDGARRDASEALAGQQARIEESDQDAMMTLRWMASAAANMREHLDSGDFDAAGSLLNEAWHRKRSLGIKLAGSRIDEAYHLAIEAGATGAKLCGAGISGTFLAWVSPSARADVKSALEAQGWHELAYQPSARGVRCDVITAGEEAGG
jgi:D-glycero-alpha-D-manno-heptose-7-phosphate kinase